MKLLEWNPDLETCKKWGLYIGKAVMALEPDVFSSLSLFLINNNKDVNYSKKNSIA